MEAASRGIWLLRRLPIVRKLVQKKIPVNMNAGQIELFMAIDKVGNSIYKEFEKKSSEFNRPLTPLEIYSFLDQIFLRDFETYTSYKKGEETSKPIFHLLFHP